MALSVLSLNCNGIRDASKRAGLLHWVRSLPVRPDIICLQEVHCSSVQECSSWFQSSGFGVACSPGSVRSSGCAILSRDSLSVSDSWCDAEGCYLQCEFSFQDQSFRVCCLYVPNRNPARDSFLHDLQVKIDFSVPSLFCGDFNTVFDWALDRCGSDPSDTSRESSSALRGLFDACSVVDIFCGALSFLGSLWGPGLCHGARHHSLCSRPVETQYCRLERRRVCPSDL